MLSAQETRCAEQDVPPPTRKGEPLAAVQRYTRTQEEYEFLISESERNLYDVDRAMNCKWYARAAFNLHQAVEFSFKAALVVFDGLRPQAHRLDVLGAMLACYTDDIGVPVPADAKEAGRLNEILEAGNENARYDRNFVVSHRELLRLHDYVEALTERVEALCAARLAILAQAAGVAPDNSRASSCDAR
jgi:HEPN domain-containing protein